MDSSATHAPGANFPAETLVEIPDVYETTFEVNGEKIGVEVVVGDKLVKLTVGLDDVLLDDDQLAQVLPFLQGALETLRR